ncbi:TonB-dependent receptor [bacterium]|nr:TonB-dependent receptor [bacterium]
MNRLFRLFLFLSMMLFALSAWADNGKIAGTVVDEYGDGVIGAAVQLVETSQGIGVMNLDGSYSILGVEPGTYTVRVSSIGYGTQTFTDVVVSGGLTTTLNVVLTEEALQGEEVIVEWQRPTVILDKPTKSKILDKAIFKSSASGGSISAVITKQPGFKIDSEGKIHFRGGRDTEALVKVDGQVFRDPISSSTSANRLVNFSALNVEEIEILTGGDASHGGYQSALINVTTPEGSMTDYSGVVEYRSDRAFSNYSFDTDQYDYSLSGPVPLIGDLLGWKKNDQKLSFFTSGSAKLTNTYAPYAINRDPNDYLGLGFDIPERQSNDYTTFWKLTYRIDPTKKLNFSFNRDHGLWDVYPQGEAAILGNYGWQYKYNVENRPYIKNKRSSFNLGFSHNVTQNTLYEVSFGRFTTRTEIRPRGKNPDEFTLRDDIEDRNIRDLGAGGDVNNNGIPDGYWDANDNEQYDGEGEGYNDENGNGRWDRGEDWVDLNGNGVYDYAEPWLDRANAQGVNNVGVWDSWDPYVDLNGNGRWDDAEPQLAEQDWNKNGLWDGEVFVDANGNGRYDGWGEGYDDRNLNGSIDHQDVFTDEEDTGEGAIDGDFYFDTGEPFIDQADVNGIYNGVWDAGEPWLDLPSGYAGNDFAPRQAPTRNGTYDGPNGAFDEYELFTMPAELGFGMDPRQPVIYTWANLLEEFPIGEPPWLNMYYASYMPQTSWAGVPMSTWTNMTIHDTDAPVFNIRNGTWDAGQEVFIDYNNNGVWDGRADEFLNPGQWDASAFWQDREATEYSAKFKLTSQVNKSHELKTGFELKYRDLIMNSIQGPDILYANEDFPLPDGSPYPDRGDVRDFYDHQPWEGSVYFMDKMEFEGLIVQAGVRSDFIIQGDGLLEETQRQVDRDQPGALLAKRGQFAIAPRLGISHPVSDKSKLYFNYGHYYQTPDFQYFYQAATANIDPNTYVGNPNLEYERTVSYEVGVNTEFAEDWVIDVAGYYRDVYNQIGTIEERIGPVTLNRYFNLGYARARGFEFSLEKKFSRMWALTGNYDFSFAFGKESAASEGLIQRQNNVPENRDEYPLVWDQTHVITTYLTFMVDQNQELNVIGMRMPSDWLATFEFSYETGKPYTPGTYIEQKPSNLILPNSARRKPTATADLKFDKFWHITEVLRLSTGFEILNLFNRKNVSNIYSATGNSHDSTHELDPNEVPDDNMGSDYDHNPTYYAAPRQVLLHFKLEF